MPCLNPTYILSPETRWLRKCRKENRSYEYYIHMANQKRNLQYDPAPLVDNPYDYYDRPSHSEVRRMIVPCGKCDGCLKRKVDKYFIRCYYEWLDCKFARNGSTWFLTLTYGDEVLPRLDDGSPCFDKEHVRLFFVRLRKYSGLRFRYFVVSEFGGEFGRPHYHALLFIDDFPYDADHRSNHFKLLEHVANAWTKLVDRDAKYSSMNHFGLFDVQRVQVDPVDSARLIRYTAKYVGKQFGAEDFDKRSDVPDNNKRFHHASIGLGESLYKYCNKDVWDKGLLELDGFKYSIPDYYRLKIMREYYCTADNGDIIYRPSDFSLQYQYNMCRRQVEEHKTLALLNSDYPLPPQWTYDPPTLNYFYKYLDEYYIFRKLPQDVDLIPLVSDWQDYLSEVQKYNMSHYKAQVEKWKRQQEEHYLKKTGRK